MQKKGTEDSNRDGAGGGRETTQQYHKLLRNLPHSMKGGWIPCSTRAVGPSLHAAVVDRQVIYFIFYFISSAVDNLGLGFGVVKRRAAELNPLIDHSSIRNTEWHTQNKFCVK
jgi:hypothetical protein